MYKRQVDADFTRSWITKAYFYIESQKDRTTPQLPTKKVKKEKKTPVQAEPAVKTAKKTAKKTRRRATRKAKKN